MKIENKLHANCSEWDTAVYSDYYEDNYKESNYPEIYEIVSEASKIKEWD